MLSESESDATTATFSLNCPRGVTEGEVRPLARRRCVRIHVQIDYNIVLR